jgi:myo-inositol-1(or 4)-monophosphatase
MNQMTPEAALAIEALQVAQAILKEAAKGPVLVAHQEGRDIKLEVDRLSEEAIIGVLKGSGVPILAEESGATFPVSARNELSFWVVDPLDGSYNFARGLGLAGISLAYVEKGEPVLGAIMDLASGTWFMGGRSCSAYDSLGGAVCVSKMTQAGKAMLLTGFPVHRDYSMESLSQMVSHLRLFKKVRMLGSAVRSLQLVASGVGDVYWEEGIQFWDIAGGIALIQAAGGVVRWRFVHEDRWLCRVVAAATEEVATDLWPLI